jgi:ABC-type multidrug transport system ATPase subunit
VSEAADFAVETDGLTRRFGAFVAVDHVTLRIPKGQLYGFLGLNGAGKTTTIRVLTTLLPPSGGTAKLWGHDVVKEPLAVRRLVGLVSDETSESQSTWPTRGLDLPAKRDMWDLLRRLAATENVTTFLSSHDSHEIRSLCHEISVIAKGKLVYTGATRELGSDLDAFEERLIDLLTQAGDLQTRR